NPRGNVVVVDQLFRIKLFDVTTGQRLSAATWIKRSYAIENIIRAASRTLAYSIDDLQEAQSLLVVFVVVAESCFNHRSVPLKCFAAMRYYAGPNIHDAGALDT